jgi:hypothetical protein
MAASTHLNRTPALALLSFIAVLGLCSFQYEDKYNLNSMPFAQVSHLTSDLTKAQKLANHGNIEVLAGQALQGRSVRLRGELTDANCLLSRHAHAYDHAFCAKLCVASGSPLLFLPDEGGQVLLVLLARSAIRIPDSVLDKIEIPGIMVTGKMLSSSNVTALAVEAVDK